MKTEIDKRASKLIDEIRNTKKKVQNEVLIHCPHCNEKIKFKKDKVGRIIGTIAGGGIGAGLASGLGIAGAILSAPISIPATLVGAGIFALLGNKFGKEFDNSRPKCPKCEKKIIL